MSQPTSNKDLMDTLNAYHKTGSQLAAAKLLNMSPSTLRSRLRAAEKIGLKSKIPFGDSAELNAYQQLSEAQARIRALETSANIVERDKLTCDYVKTTIIKLAKSKIDVPKWLSAPPKKKVTSGVPTIFASDWHWAEVVDSKQIGGVNSYNIKIAQERARTLIETSVDLLKNHFANPIYPGIVFVLGGDMVSGDIHEELSASNEMEMMPTVLDIWAVLSWCINRLADEFGKVFIPCVTGNHGRSTFKIRNKGRNHTSFDWLIYQFLAKRFEGDDRIHFLISDGADAYYSVYGHKYLLTHGDQFRGGDGVIGALGPIIRGDHRKRSRNSQIDQEYDTMLLGHWHQLIQLQRLIVNGSLKGYDEYAYNNNFPFEPPRQALWITHPAHGITFSAPVYVDRKLGVTNTNWISWT